MKPCHLLIAGLCLLLPITEIFAQDKAPVKFGKISPADFELAKNHYDTSVSAVVIADIGSSSFEGNAKGWFSLLFKRQKRVKILSKNGFDAANIEVLLYSEGQAEERLENLKANTYNLENGTVVETKLSDAAVFKEKVSKNLLRKKFTFPAVKEGSIIEFSYTISSDFLFNLQPWTFQCEYPCLWSEYQVNLPEFFNYVSLSQGYNPFAIQTSSNTYSTFNVTDPGNNASSSSEHFTLRGTVVNRRWVMKDVPALKEENFTSTIRNHVSKIEFQLSQYRFPDMPVKEIMGNWVTASEEMMKREEFGMPIEKNNNWLDDDLKSIVGSSTNKIEKAQKIFAFVRDHFTCTGHHAVLMSNTLKAIFKNKSGSEAEINLLLIAMLRHENIEVNPVILSTRENGFAHELYPLMNRYNYVIAAMQLDSSKLYLDASQPLLGFGKLTEDCYNGCARLIGKAPAPVYFDADSLKEKKVTTVFISTDENGKLVGNYQSSLGYMRSLELRRRIKEKGEEDFTKRLRNSCGSDIKVMETGIDSLKNLENPVKVHYDFVMNNVKDDIIYFNPLMAEGYKENLFKSAERKYPVEMPYTSEETFILNMQIPENYVVDELPKSAKVLFNEGEGTFEYIIAKMGNTIQLRSRIVMQKANFLPEDYNSLRDFYGYIVKKHSEQIVFKKQKS